MEGAPCQTCSKYGIVMEYSKTQSFFPWNVAQRGNSVVWTNSSHVPPTWTIDSRLWIDLTGGVQGSRRMTTYCLQTASRVLGCSPIVVWS